MGVEETGSSGFKKKHQSNHRNKMSNHSPLAPLVSVCVQTYNHERYIEACLDGILMQQTTFPFEIILGEDESSDGTREICKAYAQKHPDKIKLFLRSRKDVIFINGRPTGRYNFIENLKASTGKYIALCEGDDYWTDPTKLQKQIEFLESNPDYVVCSHNAKVIDENGRVIQEKKIPKLTQDRDFSSLELQKGAFLLTLTMVFKNIDTSVFRSFNYVLNGDTALISLLGAHGKGRYIEDIKPAVYRVHSGGVWSLLDSKRRFMAKRQLYAAFMKYYKDQNELYLYFLERQTNLSRKMLRILEHSSNLKEYFKINLFYIHYNQVFTSRFRLKELLRYNWYYWRNIFQAH